jgi:hypothetical protein
MTDYSSNLSCLCLLAADHSVSETLHARQVQTKGRSVSRDSDAKQTGLG